MWTSKKLEEIRPKEISLNTSTCQPCLIFNHLKWQHDGSIKELCILHRCSVTSDLFFYVFKMQE